VLTVEPRIHLLVLILLVNGLNMTSDNHSQCLIMIASG